MIRPRHAVVPLLLLACLGIWLLQRKPSSDIAVFHTVHAVPVGSELTEVGLLEAK